MARGESAQGGAAAVDAQLVYRRCAAGPNEQWQADHTLLDIAILEARGEPARPWLTVPLDDHSRAVACYTVFLGAQTAGGMPLACYDDCPSRFIGGKGGRGSGVLPAEASGAGYMLCLAR